MTASAKAGTKTGTLDREIENPKRRVLIDGQNLILPRGTGIATYSRQVIVALRQMGFGVDAVIGSAFKLSRKDAVVNRRGFDLGVTSRDSSLLSSRTSSYLRGILAKPAGMAISPVDVKPPHTFDSELGRLAGIDRCLAGHDLFDAARQHAIRWGKMMPLHLPDVPSPDLFHAMQIAPMRVPGKPCVVTIHDIIPLVVRGSTLENLIHFQKFVKAILRHADHVVTVSEHSRQDLIRLMGGDAHRITNTFQTVALPEALVERSKQEIHSDLSFYGLEQGNYFMFLGAIEPKKNVRRLIEAYAGSGIRRPLIVVGGLGWNFEDDLKAMEDERFRLFRREKGYFREERQVRHLSFVPQAQLVSLLRGARGLLFPSLYEGFGLPVAEALALGTPVMTSNSSSLPEVAGDAALMVDPHDVVGMAKAIRTLDNDHDLRAELKRKGPLQVAQFSAENHRQRLEAVYNRVL
jgi:glycosyltransferase involved in cell wall biosynthesis